MITDTETYEARLARFDWNGQYSDDHSVWSRWLYERDKLLDAAKRLDQDFTIWNRYAPKTMQY